MRAYCRELLARMFAAAFLLAPAPFALAQAADYKSEYRLYNDALAAGDESAAAIHGLAAWKAAEAELGDHKTTATLAFNYGQHVLFDDPAAALPALKRAKALMDTGVAELPAQDLAIYLAYAAFKAKDENGANAKALRTALEARDVSGAAASFEAAKIWTHLAAHYLAVEDYTDAGAAAKRAEALISAVNPGDIRGRATAIMIAGVAVLMPTPRTTASVETAHDDFLRAAKLFPPQKDIVSFDPQLAKVLAWELAAHAADSNVRERGAGKAVREKWDAEPMPVSFEGAPPIRDCRIELKTPGPPAFPTQSLSEGHIGAVVVGFGIGEDGRVRDQRVLAEAPKPALGPFALGSMRRWRYKEPAIIPPACRSNRISAFAFSRP